MNRFLRLPGAAELKRPEAEELLVAAVAQLKVPLPEKAKGYAVVRSVSVKQRPRRD